MRCKFGLLVLLLDETDDRNSPLHFPVLTYFDLVRFVHCFGASAGTSEGLVFVND